MNRPLALILTFFGGVFAGCTGGSNGAVCSFDSPATLAASAWPKFRHDLQNSGTVTNTLANTGQMLWRFPAASDPAKGPFAASPVINGLATEPTSATRIYIGSTDGYMYAVDPTTGKQDPTFYFVSPSAITSTVLLTQRGGDALFFGGGDGDLWGIGSTGLPQVTNWPPAITGFLSTSPTIGSTDGTIYGASLNGFIVGVCPNGVDRFVLSTSGVQSSPAIGPEATTLYYGGDDRQLRAIATNGVLLWAFSASGAILNAPVLAGANGVTTAIYVADGGGLIFKVGINGLPVSGFKFSNPEGVVPVGPMQSSPALAGNRLYVGSDDGNLYAVDATTGTVAWAFLTGGPIVSSPAVATGGAEPVIVVGSNDGNVYFVRDTGPAAEQIAKFTIPVGSDDTIYPVRSSPTIGADGTVYVGADDGRLYAIH